MHHEKTRFDHCVREYLKNLETLREDSDIRSRDDLPIIAAVCTMLAEQEDTLHEVIAEYLQ